MHNQRLSLISLFYKQWTNTKIHQMIICLLLHMPTNAQKSTLFSCLRIQKTKKIKENETFRKIFLKNFEKVLDKSKKCVIIYSVE